MKEKIALILTEEEAKTIMIALRVLKEMSNLVSGDSEVENLIRSHLNVSEVSPTIWTDLSKEAQRLDEKLVKVVNVSG